jgi:hypothetical protein
VMSRPAPLGLAMANEYQFGTSVSHSQQSCAQRSPHS